MKEVFYDGGSFVEMWMELVADVWCGLRAEFLLTGVMRSPQPELMQQGDCIVGCCGESGGQGLRGSCTSWQKRGYPSPLWV